MSEKGPEPDIKPRRVNVRLVPLADIRPQRYRPEWMEMRPSLFTLHNPRTGMDLNCFKHKHPSLMVVRHHQNVYGERTQ
jgi:hypothetical protein